MPKPPPAIALVPGFLGFEHSGDQTYFADRFVAGLRGALEARGVGSIPVVSVSTLGIAGLVERQRDLLHELELLETPERLGPRTWHLVGHSTGGVDAAMLLRESPLAHAEWGKWQALVERVSSVTTMAAPHWGTGLAAAPLARFVSGHPSLEAVPAFAQVLFDVARRDDLASRIRFALSAAPRMTKMPFFLLHMMLMNDLARDLHPAVMAPLAAKPVRASATDRIHSIATVCPRPPVAHSDKLFRDMWRWTHEGAIGLDASNVPVLPSNDHTLRLPSQRDIVLDENADGGDNDGVVTSRRQIFGKLIGIVVGDHVDVLGRYRRASLVDRKLIDPGLLTSGAEFQDDEFFDLLGLLGETIAGLIESA